MTTTPSTTASAPASPSTTGTRADPASDRRPSAHLTVVHSPLDPELVATAVGQHGMLTTAQATAAGLSAATLVALVKAGVLRHPGRGLYAVESLVDPEPEGWHRQLCAGARHPRVGRPPDLPQHPASGQACRGDGCLLGASGPR